MNAEAFIMKGKSVIAMSQGDVIGGLYGCIRYWTLVSLKILMSRDSCHLGMRTGSSTFVSKLTCSLKILKDHNFRIHSF